MSANQIWPLVFNELSWLRLAKYDYRLKPFMIGPRLDEITSNFSLLADPIQVTIVAGDISGDLMYEKEIFLGSLRPYTWISEARGILKLDSGLVLDVGEPLYGRCCSQKSMDDVFREHDGQLIS